MTGTAPTSMPSGPPLPHQDASLSTHRMRERLNHIAQARANGVGELISLPQLVVCGNQSAGKSSVLEAITSIPFPRKDGLCTRFPTEIIIRDAPEQPLTMIASIIPDSSRGYVNSQILQRYNRSLSGYEELSGVIEDVSELMGLKTYSDDDDRAPAFVADILRIEVTGPTGLYLSIVDLPGLIGGSEDDELVRRVVDSYLKEPRAIILAVLPAESDIETQPIIRRARIFDKAGQRTIGIITKVDLINRGTENRIAALLRNQGPIKMELGYFLMKNPSPDQLFKGVTTEQRHRKEQEHFQRPEWRSLGLDPSRIGARALCSHCQILLEEHFEKEIPLMQTEIAKLIDAFQEELVDLGEERTTPMSQRLFLSNLIFKFIELVQSTTNGSYDDQSLQLRGQQEDDLLNNRLRAQVHLLNTDFANFMRDYSQKYQPLTDAQRGSPPESHLSIMGRPEALAAWQYKQWIMDIYTNTRGLELPGGYNYNLLSGLFHDQASRWPEIAQCHVRVIYSHLVSFLDRALAHVVKEKNLRHQLQNIIHAPKQKMLEDALEELYKICQDEKMQPITYNHYFTDNIQKARQDSMKKQIEKMVDASIISLGLLKAQEAKDTPNKTKIDRATLSSSLQSQVEVNMDKNTCDEASVALSSYYKVAMKTFVDNVCRQVVERHMMRKLRSILDPSTILCLSDKEIAQIAMEPEARVNRRKELQTKLGSLKVTLANLQF